MPLNFWLVFYAEFRNSAINVCQPDKKNNLGWRRKPICCVIKNIYYLQGYLYVF